MAKVLLEYDANIGELKAVLKQIEDANVQITESATQSAKKVTDEYAKTSQAAKNAFAGQEVKKAVDNQAQSIDNLRQELEDLFNEQVKLLRQEKQNTQAFKDNAQALDATRKEFDKINGSVKQLNNSLPKTSKDVGELEDELRKLALEGKQGSEEFQNIAKRIGEYRAAITSADRAVDLYAKSTDAATSRIGELEDKLFDLAIAGQRNTQEFKDTIAEVAKLKRAVFEVDQQVDSYVERSRGLATVVQNVELIGNAFQIAQGASAIFGDESKELEEALIKLNGILAITNGLSQVRTILLEQDAKKTGIAAIAQRAYALAVGSSTGAMKAFRLALAGTGVGLLVIALGELISAFASTKEATEDQTQANRELQESYDNLTKSVQSAGARLNKARTEQLVLEGKLSQAVADRINLEIDANDEIARINEEANKKETARLEQFRAAVKENANLRKIEEKLLSDDLRAIEEERATLERAIRLELSNEIKRLNKERVKSQKRTQFELTELETKGVETRLSVIQAAAKKQLQLLNLPEEAQQKAVEQFASASRATISILQGEIAEREKLNLNTFEQRKQLLIEQNILDRFLAEQNISDVKEQNAEIFRLNQQLNKDLNELEKERNDDLIQQVFAYVSAISNAFSSIADLSAQVTENRIADIERLRDAEIKANNTAEQSYAKRKRNEEAINTRFNRRVTEEKRKQARIDKASGIFEAVLNTAVAVTNALKEKPPLNFILAAIAGAAGAVQIAKISSEPLPAFGKGGWVDGEPHTRGGVNINAEGGEFVTNKQSARTHKAELEAMNKGRESFLKLIQERYVRPQLVEAMRDKDRGFNVNVDARLNSSTMEKELIELRRETKRTGKAISKVLTSNHSSRYSW